MMKKTAILALSTVLASQLMAAEDISEMLKEGKAGGYIRLHHIFEDVTNRGIAHTGSVVAGKLKYQTGALYGLRFGAAMYTTHDTGLTKTEMTGEVAGGLLGDDFGNYSTLGEAYASYHLSNTDITYGRQEFKTPMTEAPVTFIPNLFEGTVATIKELPNTTITAAHITKMQYGTRSLTERNLLGDETYGITAGTGITSATTAALGGGLMPGWGKEKFQDMGLAMFGRTAAGVQRVDSAGVTSLGIDYKSGDFKARAWDYYAHEMYNTIYADAEYKMDIGGAKVTLGAQALKQDDVGDFQNGAGGTALKGIFLARTLARQIDGVGFTNIYRTQISADGSIDAMLWGAKARADIGDFSFEAAFNKNEDGHVINTWGGDPGYTSTIFSRNEFRADTTSYKLGAEYNLNSFVPGLKFIYNYAMYDSDVKTTATWNGTAWVTAPGMRNEQTVANDYILHYVSPSIKGLMVRLFYVNRTTDTRQYEQDHVRLVAGLNF